MKNVSVAMLDDLAPLAARLSKSLKSHQVNASTDQVMDLLSGMVDSLANGKRPVLAVADTNDSEAPAYNIPADFICTAYAHFTSGQTEKALKHVLIAFESEGMNELAQAMAKMNDEATDDGEMPDITSDTSILAAVADDSDADGDEDDASSPFTADDTDGSAQDDGWNIFDNGSDDDDEDDNDDGADDSDDDDDSVIEGVLSEMKEPPVMDVSDDDDSIEADDDEDSLTNRFRSVSASTTTRDRKSVV